MSESHFYNHIVNLFRRDCFFRIKNGNQDEIIFFFYFKETESESEPEPKYLEHFYARRLFSEEEIFSYLLDKLSLDILASIINHSNNLFERIMSSAILIYTDQYTWETTQELINWYTQYIKEYLLQKSLYPDEMDYVNYSDYDYGTYSGIISFFMKIKNPFVLKKILLIIKTNVVDVLNEASQFSKQKFYVYQDFQEFLFHCSQILPYPDFYEVWHSQPNIIHPEILEISPLGNTKITQVLNQQILDLPSQLKPTEKTYPIVINAQSLKDETDNDSIAQELCNQIYAIAFPNETDIPEINNAPKLKRLIPNIKKQLNTQNLALIFHNGEPNESLTKFCKKLTDVIHIKWITEQPIAYGVPPQENLINILQNWIDHLD